MAVRRFFGKYLDLKIVDKRCRAALSHDEWPLMQNHIGACTRIANVARVTNSDIGFSLPMYIRKMRLPVVNQFGMVNCSWIAQR